MKALTLLLVVALAAPAWADPPVPTPADAPVKVAKGSVVPFDGVLDTEPGFVSQVRSHRGCEAERDVLRRGPPVGLVVLVAVIGVAVGGAVGAGLTYAATRPRP